MTFAATWPCLKRISVGIESTSKVRGGLLVVVDVELDDLQRLAALAGDLLEHRRDHAARPAPGRPEVDEHRRVGLEDLGLEAVVGDFVDGGHAAFRAPSKGGDGRDVASQSIATASARRAARRCLPQREPSTRGVTQTSTAAAASRIGTATASVTNVAASRSSHSLAAARDRPGRERQEQRGQLRQRVQGEDRRAARPGRCRTGGERRRVVAQDVGLRARARTASRRRRTRSRAAAPGRGPGGRRRCSRRRSAGSEEPAMKPATQASACSASTSELRNSTKP